MTYNRWRLMGDDQLHAAIRRLEAKVQSLRLATSAISRRLLDEFSDSLDRARAEVERRRT